MARVRGKEHKNSDRLGNKLGKEPRNRAKKAPIYYIGRKNEKKTVFFNITVKRCDIINSSGCLYRETLQAHQKTTEETTEGKTEKVLLSE